MFPFVREITAQSKNREVPAVSASQRLLGYAILDDATENSNVVVNRRAWELEASDPRGFCAAGGLTFTAPDEGVVPASIQINVASQAAAPALRQSPAQWPTP